MAKGGMHGRGECMDDRGLCMAEGHVWWGGMDDRGACLAGEMATAADSMHPTGMHSCLKIKIPINFLSLLKNLFMSS